MFKQNSIVITKLGVKTVKRKEKELWKVQSNGLIMKRDMDL